jgi:hypothetical protein
VVITAKVWLGFTLQVDDSRSTLTKEEVYSYGCHSIHGTRQNGDEYVVFDAENVASVDEVEVVTGD